MDLGARFQPIRSLLTKEIKSDVGDNILDWLTFIIGLLPDPTGCMLAPATIPAQIANKLMSDSRLGKKFQDLMNRSEALDARLTEVESGMERVSLIGLTVSENMALQRELNALIGELKRTIDEAGPSEFLVDTSNWSAQEIVRTLVQADWVKIAARHFSENTIADSTFHSRRTHLIADDNSRNKVRDSEFHGDGGKTGVSGEIHQQGHVRLEDSSIAFDAASRVEHASPEGSAINLGDHWSMNASGPGWGMETNAAGPVIRASESQNSTEWSLDVQVPGEPFPRSVFSFRRERQVHLECPHCKGGFWVPASLAPGTVIACEHCKKPSALR